MANLSRWLRWISFLLVGLGVVLLGVSFWRGGTANVALPLVFLMLGVFFYILVVILARTWAWSPLLYIPGSILLALGMIFLLNVITNDWQSWAYAWLLLVAGIGLGLVLVNGQLKLRREVTLVGWGLIIGGLTLFALFGAIAGGLFIQIMAPILLVLGGFLLYKARLETILPEQILRRFRPEGQAPTIQPASPDQGSLVEPLSAREIEVLRLVDDGLSNAEIASRLVVAPSTVKTHINNLYGKLGVQTRTQAIKRARELGLVGPDQGQK